MAFCGLPAGLHRLYGVPGLLSGLGGGRGHSGAGFRQRMNRSDRRGSLALLRRQRHRLHPGLWSCWRLQLGGFGQDRRWGGVLWGDLRRRTTDGEHTQLRLSDTYHHFPFSTTPLSHRFVSLLPYQSRRIHVFSDDGIMSVIDFSTKRRVRAFHICSFRLI